MDKQSAIALGVTAGIGVGYLLGRTQVVAPSKQQRTKTAAASAKHSDDEVERLIRPNILSLTPYRCARDDYDQGACVFMTRLLDALSPAHQPTHMQSDLHMYHLQGSCSMRTRTASVRR